MQVTIWFFIWGFCVWTKHGCSSSGEHAYSTTYNNSPIWWSNGLQLYCYPFVQHCPVIYYGPKHRITCSMCWLFLGSVHCIWGQSKNGQHRKTRRVQWGCWSGWIELVQWVSSWVLVWDACCCVEIIEYHSYDHYFVSLWCILKWSNANQLETSQPACLWRKVYVCSKWPPFRNILWGEGGRAAFREQATFIIEQATDENIVNFQGVPHAFDHDRSCSITWNNKCLFFKSNMSLVKFVISIQLINLWTCWHT